MPGMPAHVTVLYPFVPPTAVTDTVIQMVSTAVASVAAFRCEFARTRWFGKNVLWLAPEPAWPFQALTISVQAEFPNYLLYGGVYGDVVPHLTVSDRPAEGYAALRRVEAELEPSLPVQTQVTHTLLMAKVGSDNWRTIAAMPLGT